MVHTVRLRSIFGEKEDELKVLSWQSGDISTALVIFPVVRFLLQFPLIICFGSDTLSTLLE